MILTIRILKYYEKANISNKTSAELFARKRWRVYQTNCLQDL